MFLLFAFAKDDTGAITNTSLIRDLQQFHGIQQFRVFEKPLHMPRTTIVVMEKAGWEVRIDIRPGEHMTLSLSALKKLMGKNASKLPANFMDYNCEIAIGFGDDPDQVFTDDIIEIGEFFRTNYPGLVIFDQYNDDLW